MSTSETKSSGPSRRNVVKGAAWAVPAVVVASAAPAAAQSPCIGVTWSGSSCKCPGAPNNYTYQLSVCFTNNCSGPATVVVKRMVSNSGVTLQPVIEDTVHLDPGETECTTLRTYTSTNSANFIDVFFTVNGGAEQFVRLASPPDCADGVCPD